MNRQTVSLRAQHSNRIAVTDRFTLLNNQWGNPEAQQQIQVRDDGSYGWTFDATGTDSGINYPEVFVGTRPWGSDTGTSAYPIQRGDLDELVFDIEADYDISGGEWDWAQEWWLLEEPPSVETETHQYEVMLLLDWGGGHDHGSPVQTDLWTDDYGNTIDLWAMYDSGGTNATFYIFRIQGGHEGGKIDAKRITDWLTSHEGISEDLWISGSELGNEYWPGATGSNTVERFDVTINGTTYTSGPSPSNEFAVAVDDVTISQGDTAEISIDGTSVQSVTLSNLWADWTVTSVDADGASVDKAVETAGECRFEWPTRQSSVSPSITVTPPSDTYVGGQYLLTGTATAGEETVTTTGTFTID